MRRASAALAGGTTWVRHMPTPQLWSRCGLSPRPTLTVPWFVAEQASALLDSDIATLVERLMRAFGVCDGSHRVHGLAHGTSGMSLVRALHASPTLFGAYHVVHSPVPYDLADTVALLRGMTADGGGGFLTFEAAAGELRPSGSFFFGAYEARTCLLPLSL